MRKSNLSIRKQAGITAIEATIASAIIVAAVAALSVAMADYFDTRSRAGKSAWFAQYVNGVAAYVAAQGVTAPATLTRNGTDWLKSVDCGGAQPVDNYYLPCNIPTDFNGVYGLGAPSVTFDWSTPRVPTAAITFGPVLGPDSLPDTPGAGALISEINQRLEVDGYQFAEAFLVDPATADPVAAANEMAQANMRAFIDTAVESTTFVRLDGNSIMKGPLVNHNDSWALIGRDQDGNENADALNPTASLNINDAYVRSADIWLSELNELAEESYRLAIRAPVFVSNVRSGTTISRPDCPAPLTEKISAVPAGFVGGPATDDPRFIAGARTRVNESATNYTVWLDLLYDGESTFQTVPAPPDPRSSMGLINVSIKCSDA